MCLPFDFSPCCCEATAEVGHDGQSLLVDQPAFARAFPWDFCVVLIGMVGMVISMGSGRCIRCIC